MKRDEIIRYGLDLCKQELGIDGTIFIPKLINTCYINANRDFELELKAEYKRGWKDRATQSDLENSTCNNCRSQHCDIKIALIKNDSMNPDYFNCNDWEQK